MSGYPDYSRRQTIRVGVAFCAAVALLVVVGVVIDRHSKHWWDVEIPVDPGAVATPRLSKPRWPLYNPMEWLYRSKRSRTDVLAFHDAALKQHGWSVHARPDGNLEGERRGLQLLLFCSAVADGTEVRLLLAPAAMGWRP